jgi:hypothetical protein
MVNPKVVQAWKVGFKKNNSLFVLNSFYEITAKSDF